MTDEQFKEKIEDLVDEIGSQASNFSFEKNLSDFEITVRITCEDGWCSADLIRVNNND